MDPPATIYFELMPPETSPVAYLTLINKSQNQIIFKIKTTKPASYIVRPNQGAINPSSESKVTVLFNHALDSPVRNKSN